MWAWLKRNWGKILVGIGVVAACVVGIAFPPAGVFLVAATGVALPTIQLALGLTAGAVTIGTRMYVSWEEGRHEREENVRNDARAAKEQAAEQARAAGRAVQADANAAADAAQRLKSEQAEKQRLEGEFKSLKEAFDKRNKQHDDDLTKHRTAHDTLEAKVEDLEAVLSRMGGRPPHQDPRRHAGADRQRVVGAGVNGLARPGHDPRFYGGAAVPGRGGAAVDAEHVEQPGAEELGPRMRPPAAGQRSAGH